MTTKTSQTRETYSAQYDYPGLLFPESKSRPVEAPTIAAAVAAQPDDNWYAIHLDTKVEKLFHADDGAEAWVTQSHERTGRYVVGHKVHVDDVPDNVDGHDTHILKANIRSNSEDHFGVVTRRGNWQIAQDYDGVINPDTMEVEA